jgi:hypothetical protein
MFNKMTGPRSPVPKSVAKKHAAKRSPKAKAPAKKAPAKKAPAKKAPAKKTVTKAPRKSVGRPRSSNSASAVNQRNLYKRHKELCAKAIKMAGLEPLKRKKRVSKSASKAKKPRKSASKTKKPRVSPKSPGVKGRRGRPAAKVVGNHYVVGSVKRKIHKTQKGRRFVEMVSKSGKHYRKYLK